MTRKALKFKVLAITAVITVALSACAGPVDSNDNIVTSSGNLSDIMDQANSSGEESSSESEQPKTATVTLTAVGDNLIHRPIYQQAHARANQQGYDFTYPYENIADYIAAADIAIYNQETIVAPDYEPSSYPSFCSPKELGVHMVDIGFDVVSLANNHSFDKGSAGLKNSLEFWDTQDIVTTGAYLNEQDFNTVSFMESNDVKFGFVAFIDPTNGLSLPADSEMTVLLQSKFDQIEAKIKQAKEECDIVIVIPHWGWEYTTQYNDSQAEIAQKLADCGADIIIGSHSHCIQPIETVTSADGREVLVCYSLGNFISGQLERLRVVGGMVDLTITYDFNKKSFNLDDVDFSPIITHYEGGCNNIRIYKFSDYTNDMAQKHGVAAMSGSALSRGYVEDLVTSVIDEKYLADDWK